MTDLQPSARPPLNRSLDATEFGAWYWLKAELVAFCRERGISYVGSKPEVAQRVAQMLSGGAVTKAAVARRVRGEMPTTFTPATRIGRGWTCGPTLGKFFKQHCGAGFRFNAAMRAFIHDGEGKTLAAAIQCYRASVAVDAPRQAIIAQNEYNRFTREYFAQHPAATRAQVLDAWRRKRNQRRD